MKSGQLKRDPDAIAAFVARGRTSSPLRRSEGLARTSRPARSIGRQKPAGRPAEPRWETSPECRAFWASIEGKVCAVCGGRDYMEPHHLVTKRWIRDYVMSLRITDPAERAQHRLTLLGDVRNALACCGACHANHTAGALVIPRRLIPAAAFEFAAELGEPMLARLERRYP
jgi:hypothetical protein